MGFQRYSINFYCFEWDRRILFVRRYFLFVAPSLQTRSIGRNSLTTIQSVAWWAAKSFSPQATPSERAISIEIYLNRFHAFALFLQASWGTRLTHQQSYFRKLDNHLHVFLIVTSKISMRHLFIHGENFWGKFSIKKCESRFPYCFLTDFTKFFLQGSTLLDFGFLTEKASWIHQIFIIWCHDKKNKKIKFF